MTRIVVLGPSGSGRGPGRGSWPPATRVSHLSVGTLLRTEIASHSARGDRVAATVAAGELVATDDVVAVLRGPLAVSATVGGWVLDGAPRTAEQAATLAEMIEGPAPSRAIVIALDVPEDELEPASFVGRGWRQERTTTPW